MDRTCFIICLEQSVLSKWHDIEELEGTVVPECNLKASFLFCERMGDNGNMLFIIFFVLISSFTITIPVTSNFFETLMSQLAYTSDK